MLKLLQQGHGYTNLREVIILIKLCIYNTYLHFPLKGSRIAYCVCFHNKINKENMQMYFSAIEELLK